MNYENICRALVHGVVGAIVMYCAKGLTLEGRMVAIEGSMQRIETRLMTGIPGAIAP